MRELLEWMVENHPELETCIAWNQPMFTHHGTFIVGFSASKAYLSGAAEDVVLERMRADFTAAGYKCLKRTVNFPPSKPLPFDLPNRAIAEQIELKKGVTSFWLPAEMNPYKCEK